MLIRSKASLLLVVFIIVILGVGGALSLRFLEGALRKAVFNGLESLSIASAESISRFLEDTLKDAEVIGSLLPTIALEEKDVSVIERELRKMTEIQSKFENGMFILDTKGDLWVDYPPHPEARGKNFAFREYFKTTMEKKQGIIGVAYRSIRTGEPVVTFTALLRGTSNEVIGVLGCSVQLLHPKALGGIRKSKIGESGYLYVYDMTRLMILHPEEGRVLQRDVPPGANKLFDAAIEGFEGTGETINSRGVPMLLSLRHIPGTNWILGAQQPKQEAFAPIRSARNRIMGWGAFAALVAILTGSLAVRGLTKPLVKLRKVAMQLGQHVSGVKEDFPSNKAGVQEELDKIRGSDEIGDLAKAFSEMHRRLGETFLSLRETIKSLRESEERYRTLAEAARDMIFIIHPDGSVRYINEFAAKQLKLLPREVIGKQIEELFPREVAQRHRSSLQEVFESGKPLYRENLTPFPEGGIWLDTWLVPIVGESGEVTAVLGISRDITERKKMEEALRQSEEKYRSLVANANDAIFIAQDEVVKFPNPSTLAMTGYSVEEHGKIPFAHLIHPEDKELVLDRYRRRMQGEEVPNNYPFRVFNKAGEELWVQLNAVLIEWDGKPAVLCFLRDITPQKRLEAQFFQAQKMEAVGTLAGGIAHDFNNLLQTVMGYSEILLSETEKEGPSYRELQAIRQAARRGAELTRQLLTYSRKVQSKLRPVNLNQEILQVDKLLKRTLPKMIEVDLKLADDLNVIGADPVHVEQILINLAVNARDAMPEGGRLTIKTQNILLDEKFADHLLGARSGRFVQLTVSDTGHGMGKETLKHLFEPFYTTKGVGKGTGLGLAMVYGIVKSHEGYILCESELDKGTTFTIYFPVIEQRIEPEGSPTEDGIEGGIETVLVVDDEEPILAYSQSALSKFGYTVLTASDGGRALEVFQSHKKIDLIILDVIMPGMGGRTCLEELLKISPEVKVVISSGYSSKNDVEEWIAARAKGFINKPYDIHQILKKIRQVLDDKP